MIWKTPLLAAGLLIFTVLHLCAQTPSVLFVEKFDTVSAPTLPSGWTTTGSKNASGDFITTTSTSHSPPNAAVTTDSRVSQSLISPGINFAGRIAGSLSFYERRTSTHNSGFLVEASAGSDTSFAIRISDTLWNPGSTNYVLRSLQLPASLDNEPTVRFRWRVVGNGTGGTGTLRIDDVSVMVRKVTDLAITGIRIAPLIPRNGMELTVHVGITNMALGGDRSFGLELFDDRNQDSLLAPSEKVEERSFARYFAPAESTTLALHYPLMPAGNHHLVVKLTVAGDEDTTNNVEAKDVFVGYAPSSVLVNEIMYAPAAGPEWVECLNNSGDTVSLSRWKIGDNTASRSVITMQEVRIPPGHLFVITRDSTIVEYFPAIHVPLIKSFFATLNNDFDAVVITDPTGFAVDSVSYSSSWGGTNGRSLERIDAAQPSNERTNWGSALYERRGTPGMINTLTQKESDISVAKLYVAPPAPIQNEQFEIIGVVRNIGRLPAGQYNVRFFLDSNDDSIPGADELLSEKALSTLLPDDSQKVSFSMKIAAQGTQRFFIELETERDDELLNNIASLDVVVGVRPKSLVINEIMYAPPGDMPEWIECYNAGTDVVDIKGWSVSDANTKQRVRLTGDRSAVMPGGYFLVTADSSLSNYFYISVPLFTARFSALNNTTPDAVVLFDDRGAIMDSVWYKPSWGGSNGSSLQRVDYFSSSTDSANWKNSPPTPGAENTVAKKDYDVAVRRAYARLSANGMTLGATISNEGRHPAQNIDVDFSHVLKSDSLTLAVETVRRIAVASLPPSDSAKVEFDWATNTRGMIRFVCRSYFPEDQRRSNDSTFMTGWNPYLPQSMVVNEVMYEPAPGNSEYVEFYNRSADSIDVQGWTLMGARSNSGSRNAVRFPDSPLVIPPAQFLLVASDSTLYVGFPSINSLLSGTILIENKNLSLRNSGDDILLVDRMNIQVDSVKFSPSWHNPLLNTSTVGKSLERINPSLTSNDTRNWSTSVSAAGGTPLQRNSIYATALPSAAGLALSPNPFSPDNDGIDDFLLISYSLPSTVSMVRVRCFDVQGRLIRTIVNNEPVPSHGSIIWDGLDDSRHRVRIGMYIVLFEALDATGVVVRTLKDVAVVATKL